MIHSSIYYYVQNRFFGLSTNPAPVEKFMLKLGLCLILLKFNVPK